MIRPLWLTCCLAVLVAAGNRSAPAAQPLKGLLITGGCCHDYEAQKTIITQGISQRAKITWDIVHEGGGSREHQVSVYEDENWADGYDVIVHNECFGGVTDPKFVAGIVSAHQNGVPAVFIHCSLHSYRNASNADAWRELIGVTSTSHEKHRPVTVKRADTDHPVMTEFPASWPTPNGELYKITRVWPNATVLATAYGEDTQKDHPVIWTNKLGNTRVFGTSLGHHNETMNNNVWLDLVARGVLWSVGQLDENGDPKPGYEGSGQAPISLNKPQPQADPAFSR